VHSRTGLGAFSRMFGCILAKVWVHSRAGLGAGCISRINIPGVLVQVFKGSGCRVQGAGLMVLDLGLRV
jgi:hypothetical protein